jgi:hypothetical protein
MFNDLTQEVADFARVFGGVSRGVFWGVFVGKGAHRVILDPQLVTNGYECSPEAVGGEDCGAF